MCRYGDDGALTPVQTERTLPDDFTGRNSCADLHLHPSGRFLYCSNRGHDSLARFAVSDQTGEIRLLGQTPTEKTPRSFAIDPSGRFVIAAGQASGKLAAYRVNLQTGDLDRYATIDAGQQPWWVLILSDGPAR
jgi:6-phosphogluconolactonase